MMEMPTVQRLQMYIDAETADSALYKELSKIAPTDEDKRLLAEFSEDEHSHADTFKKILKMMTGRSYSPIESMPDNSGNFFDILRDCVLDESGDYGKYYEQAINTTKNDMLKNAYLNAAKDENIHALRLLYMLNK